MRTAPSALRRIAAIAALLGGALLAWRAASQQTREAQVTFLLHRVEFRSGDAVIDRSRLVEFAWRVPTAPGAAGTLQAGSLRWAVGAAPQATPALAIALPPQIHHLEVRCTFALDGSATARSRGLVEVPSGDGAVTISAEECGQAEP